MLRHRNQWHKLGGSLFVRHFYHTFKRLIFREIVVIFGLGFQFLDAW